MRASKVPRKWERRWADAGGKFFDGRMIALKTDPIWIKISRFDRPYPPFDFGSGMGLRNITREESDALGLTQPGKEVPTQIDGTPSPSTPQGHADKLERSIKDLKPEFRAALKEVFGEQIEIEGDTARWKPLASPAGPLASPANSKPMGHVPTPEPGAGVFTQPDLATPEEVLNLNAPVEIATVYQAAKATESITGKKNSLDLGRERVERGDFRDAIVTHNHPAGNSFSDTDLGFAASADVAELRVLTGNEAGTARLYRLLRPAAGWPPVSFLMAAHADAARTVTRRQKTSGISGRAARRVFAHEVMLELSRMLEDSVSYTSTDL